MFKVGQILNPEKEGKSINELLIEHLKDHKLVITLGRLEKNWYRATFTIPIASKNCKLAIRNSDLALCFDSRFFLTACLGINGINQVKNSKSNVLKTLDKIEDVLGEVPAVQELRRNIEEYHHSIRRMLGIN